MVMVMMRMMTHFMLMCLVSTLEQFLSIIEKPLLLEVGKSQGEFRALRLCPRK
jgi:hypothetical protein